MAFKPLIYKEARRETVYLTLGEDAISIAWIIFLQFIYRYNGADYVHLPGLIRAHVHYELLRSLKKQSSLLAHETSQDDNITASIPCAEDDINRCCNEIALKQLLAHLTPLQKAVIKKLYLHGLETAQVSKLYKCSQKKTFYTKYAALTKLKKLL